MKSVLESKVVWVNTILSALAFIDLVSASPVVPAEFLPYIALGSGLLNVVLRIWFTTKPVTSALPK
jgi:hypothetical protein